MAQLVERSLSITQYAKGPGFDSQLVHFFPHPGSFFLGAGGGGGGGVCFPSILIGSAGSHTPRYSFTRFFPP